MENTPDKKTKTKATLAAATLVFLAMTALLHKDLSREPSQQSTATFLITSIQFYRHYISNHLGGVISCRFTPSCSLYAKLAIQKHGALKGTKMAIRRLYRCSRTSPKRTEDYP